jgi:AmiR/NasT family two-component response regulator
VTRRSDRYGLYGGGVQSDAARLADAERQIANLETALRSARTIGAAIGILMERMRLTDAAAFEVLNSESQRSNRKLRDVAESLVLTGLLPGSRADV